MCPPSLVAMSAVWAELKQAHPRDLSLVSHSHQACAAKWGTGFPPLHGSVELGSGFALLDPNQLGPRKPWVSDQQFLSSILARAWLDQQTAPPKPPCRVLMGTANWAFSDTSCYPGIAVSLCACLCHSLNLCSLHNSWNELKLLLGCFPLALKNSSAFVFPSVTAKHRKWSTWKMWKMVSM